MSDYYTRSEIDDLMADVPLIDTGYVYPALIFLPKAVIDRLVKEIAIFVLKRSKDETVLGGYHRVKIKGERDVILIKAQVGIVENSQRTLLHEIAHWWLDHSSGEKNDEEVTDKQICYWMNDYADFYEKLTKSEAGYNCVSPYRLKMLADTVHSLRYDDSL